MFPHLLVMLCWIPWQTTPQVELDHIWLAVTAGAPERTELERAGFRLAPGVNRHDGQGTASITVEFADRFLELIWPDTSVSVTPGRENVPANFRRRVSWRTSGWSPIGIGLRRTAGVPDSLPFPTWPVRSEWMQPGKALELLSPPSDSLGPRLWVVPRGMAVTEDSTLHALRTPAVLTHPNGVRHLTAVRIIVPRPADRTRPALMLERLGVIGLELRDGEWLLELTFDQGVRQETRDLRPALPLIVHY